MLQTPIRPICERIASIRATVGPTTASLHRLLPFVGGTFFFALKQHNLSTACSIFHIEHQVLEPWSHWTMCIVYTLTILWTKIIRHHGSSNSSSNGWHRKGFAYRLMTMLCSKRWSRKDKHRFNATCVLSLDNGLLGLPHESNGVAVGDFYRNKCCRFSFRSGPLLRLIGQVELGFAGSFVSSWSPESSAGTFDVV